MEKFFNEMDRETFNKGFKLFKRFLKEEGVYMPVIRFMFQKGRKKESLFEEFNSKKYNDVGHWRLVFDRINLLTAYMWPIDYDELRSLILSRELPEKWKKFYKEHSEK